MALDVYFKEDIQNVLTSTQVASDGFVNIVNAMMIQDKGSSPAVRALTSMYHQGFNTAIDAIAEAFGIKLSPGPIIATYIDAEEVE